MSKNKASFRLIADIHLGRDRKTRLGSAASRLMKEFVKAANKAQPDAVIDLGDRITHYDKRFDGKNTGPHSIDLSNQQIISDYFNRLSMPHLHVDGNHDLCYLSAEDNQRLLNKPSATSHSIVINGIRVILWHANVLSTDGSIHASLKDIHWLRKELAASDEPCIIISHVPFSDAAIYTPKESREIDSPYFATYPQGPWIRKIIEDSGKVVACFAGHRHIHDHIDINGVHHISVDSFVRRSHADNDQAIGAYADFVINKRKGTLTYSLHGMEPQKLKLKSPIL